MLEFISLVSNYGSLINTVGVLGKISYKTF